jgi:hypothetical protein
MVKKEEKGRAIKKQKKREKQLKTETQKGE